MSEDHKYSGGGHVPPCSQIVTSAVLCAFTAKFKAAGEGGVWPACSNPGIYTCAEFFIDHQYNHRSLK